jgi:hypothetical protein
MIMLLAFVPACLTNFRAKLADLADKRAVGLHRFHCKATYIRTLPVQADTACHHFYIVLLQTSVKTGITCFQTFQACLDTCFVLLLGHQNSSSISYFPNTPTPHKLDETRFLQYIGK